MLFMLSDFGVYDILLVVVVVIMTILISYLRNPRWKTLIISLPLPSTVATLSTGEPVNVSFLLGLPLLVLFYGSIYLLYQKLGINIIIAIIISTIGYVLTGIVILPFLPSSPLAFWIVFVFIICFALVLYNLIPKSNENEHKTMLPLYMKIPIVLTVVVLLVNMKYLLGGFMPIFPMVGVMAAYEARYCLKTVFRRLPLAIMILGPMFGVCYLVQNTLGVCRGLGLGWLVYFILFFLIRKIWFMEKIVGNKGETINQ